MWLLPERTWHELTAPQKEAARTLGYTQDDFMKDRELEAGHGHDPVDAAVQWSALVGRLLRTSPRAGGGASGSRAGEQFASRMDYSLSTMRAASHLSAASPVGSDESFAAAGAARTLTFEDEFSSVASGSWQ